MKNMDTLDTMRDLLMDYADDMVEKYGKAGLNESSAKMACEITTAICNIDKIQEADDGYSQDGGWEARGSYGRGSSYARGGRHWVRGHYSRADGYARDGGYMDDEREREMRRRMQE